MGWDGGFSAAVGANLLRGRVGEPHQVINTEIRSPRGGRYHLIPHTPIVHCTCECTRSFSYYSQKFLLGSRGLQVIFKILEIARDSKGGDYQTISFWRFFSKKFNHCIALVVLLISLTHTLPRGVMYWETHPLRDFPRVGILQPEARGQYRGPRGAKSSFCKKHFHPFENFGFFVVDNFD